jgi:pimeloyl-ACP methyl ester carboxylesterase
MVRKKRKMSKKRLWLYIGSAIILFVVGQIVIDQFREGEKHIRQDIRRAVKDNFPREAAEVAGSFGLRHLESELETIFSEGGDRNSVVLVHGLDDPGKTWMNLIPVLNQSGYGIWVLQYPNDQPIVDSARFFTVELKKMKNHGIDKIAIVGHSMGGLVTREMLTNPEIHYSLQAQEDRVPRVIALIMVGTPNHGSEFARFRIFSEIRDQWMQISRGEWHLLRIILDGAGEAKIDLLPGSAFLNTLNTRPHPQGVRLFSIAGTVSPLNKNDIDNIITSFTEKTQAGRENELVRLRRFFSDMVDGMGDGLVTVSSTQLEGIPHQTVSGTHVSMLRNISKEDKRVPPAIPLIMEVLGMAFEEGAEPRFTSSGT